MTAFRWLAVFTLVFALVGFTPTTARAEDDDSSDTEEAESPPPPQPARPRRKVKPSDRHYFTDQTPRTDAGIFHVGFAVGGNFYLEPQFDATTGSATGNSFKDFGFQGGVYFDYDYSELAENIPLMLRGMIGYKYILNSIHIGAFDGMVRYMLRFSESASMGIGFGGSAAVWYRAQGDLSPNEEVIFLPSLLVGAGFEFNPFMVDFKWLINRIGANSTIMGWELYFGFRL